MSCDEAKDTEDGQQDMKRGEARSLWKPNSIHVSIDDSSSSTVGYLSYPEIPRKDEIPFRSMALALPPSLHQSVINRQQKLKEFSQSAITTKCRVLKAHTSDLNEGIIFSSASTSNIGRSTRTLSNKNSATSKHVASNQRLFTSKIQHQQGEQLSSSTTLTAKMKLSQKDRELKAVSVPKRSRSPMIAQPVAVSKKKLLPLSFDRVEEARTVSESSRSRLDRSDILSFSDDSTGYAAAETCQSNEKRSRSAEDGGANDIPHDIDIDGTYHDDEFVDDLPNCISWNHNKKRYIDRDGLAAKVKDKYEAISIDRPPPKECGRQNCWFDLHRVACPTQVAEKGEGKLKSTDSALSQSSSPAPTTTQSDSLTKKKKQKMSTDDESFTKKTKKVMSNLFSSSNPSSPSPKSFTLPAPKSRSGCEARVFKDGTAEDLCAVEDNLTIRRRASDLDIDSQGKFDRRRVSKSKSKLVNSPNQEGSNKDHQTKRKTASSSTAMDINLMTEPCSDKSRHKVTEIERNETEQKSISDSSSLLTSSDESQHRVVKSLDTDTSDEPNDPTTRTGYIKPIIKKGEKVYACWSGPNGDGKEFFPGRVWDVRDNGVSSEYGPVMMYDIVYDDGDTESNVHEIWVIKEEEWKMYHRKPEESWIGVTNVTFPTSEDHYANTLGWYKLSSSTYVDVKNPPIYSSLGDALRAHDRQVIETKGQDNVTAKELNFPEEHGLVN